jgi:hypothetical protein
MLLEFAAAVRRCDIKSCNHCDWIAADAAYCSAAAGVQACACLFIELVLTCARVLMRPVLQPSILSTTLA